jgi:hypothetical protein
MTKCFVEKFKGNNIISIWEVDSDGKKTSSYPLVSFGVKKAKLVSTHIEEINSAIIEIESLKSEADAVPKFVMSDDFNL